MSSGGSGANRRNNDRQTIVLKVEYKRLNTFFADYTKNISKGGTFIRTDKPLDVGTEFVFALGIPNLDEPVRLRGRVMWIIPPERGTSDAPAGMGIRFQYTNDEERRATEEIVESLMRTQLGDQLSAKLLKRGQADADSVETTVYRLSRD
jgi:type IV pilus assembly protein PilZ